MTNVKDNDVVQCQDNSPDTRSGPDHQQATSNPTDQGSPDTTNTSSTDIQVHPSPVSGIDPKTIRIESHPPATQSSTPPVSPSPEAQERSPVIQHPANTPGNQLLAAMWRSPDRFHQIGTLNRQNKRFNNLQVDGVADAVAQSLKLSSEGTEVYFACAEYETPDSREAANASGAWAFWMDIDCGEDKAGAGKGYATVEDAEIALSKFCQDTGLPKPTHIVHSGGGLHVYWVVA